MTYTRTYRGVEHNYAVTLLTRPLLIFITQYASFQDREGILHFETQGNKFIKETHLNGLNHDWGDFLYLYISLIYYPKLYKHVTGNASSNF